MLVFDRGGKIIRTIGSRGTGPGKLLAPSRAGGLAGRHRLRRRHRQRPDRALHAQRHPPRLVRPLPRDPRRRRLAGRLRASTAPTRRTNRITVSTATGGDLAEIGATAELGQLRSPAGLAIDGAGNVWVADRGNDRVQAFTPGRHAADRVRRARRRRRAVHRAGRRSRSTATALVTVADSDNNRVQQFQFGARGRRARRCPPSRTRRTRSSTPSPTRSPPELSVTPTRTTRHPRRSASSRCGSTATCPARSRWSSSSTPRSGKKRPAVDAALRAAVAAGGQDGHGPAAAERGRRADAGARRWAASAGSWPTCA